MGIAKKNHLLTIFVPWAQFVFIFRLSFRPGGPIIFHPPPKQKQTRLNTYVRHEPFRTLSCHDISCLASSKHSQAAAIFRTIFMRILPPRFVPPPIEQRTHTNTHAPRHRIPPAVPSRFVFGPMEFYDKNRAPRKSMHAAEATRAFPKAQNVSAHKSKLRKKPLLRPHNKQTQKKTSKPDGTTRFGASLHFCLGGQIPTSPRDFIDNNRETVLPPKTTNAMADRN